MIHITQAQQDAYNAVIAERDALLVKVELLRTHVQIATESLKAAANMLPEVQA